MQHEPATPVRQIQHIHRTEAMMSRNENPAIVQMREECTAYGEIVTVTSDSVTIKGDFPPGLGTYDLRPGARVFILNEDAAMDLQGHREVDS